MSLMCSVGVALVMLALSGFGCGSGDICGDRLVILSPHWEGIQREFERGFGEHWFSKTGRNLSIEWLDQGGGSSIMRFIRSEFKNKPDGIGVDMMFGGGTDPYFTLKDGGYLESARLSDDILKKIPTTFAGVPLYDTTDFTWYGATMSGFGVLFNRTTAGWTGRKVPTSWDDLSRPDMRGWVGAGDPRHSGSVHMAYEIMLQAYGWQKGWDIITGICANAKLFARSSTTIPQAVATGEAIAGMSIDFYGWTTVDAVGSYHLGFVYPADMTVINPDGMGMLRGGPNPEAAREFISFVMSPPGQRLWGFRAGLRGGPKKYALGRFSIMPQLYDTASDSFIVDINPFEWSAGFVYDNAKASSRWSLVNDMIGTLLVDSHGELTQAWDMWIEAGAPDGVRSEIAAVPITEAEGLELGGKWWDQALRNRTISGWAAFARKKYERIVSIIGKG